MVQAAVVLEDYPSEVVAFVTDPRTGIASTCKFPPTLAEISEACKARVAELDRQRAADEWQWKKQESERLRPRLSTPQTCVKTANLFVPENAPRYQKMVDRHEKEPGFGSYFETRTCHDGIQRNGIWIPLSWWEEPEAVKAERRSDGPLQVTEHLKALLARQIGEA